MFTFILHFTIVDISQTNNDRFYPLFFTWKSWFHSYFDPSNTFHRNNKTYSWKLIERFRSNQGSITNFQDFFQTNLEDISPIFGATDALFFGLLVMFPLWWVALFNTCYTFSKIYLWCDTFQPLEGNRAFLFHKPTRVIGGARRFKVHF